MRRSDEIIHDNETGDSELLSAPANINRAARQRTDEVCHPPGVADILRRYLQLREVSSDSQGQSRLHGFLSRAVDDLLCLGQVTSEEGEASTLLDLMQEWLDTPDSLRELCSGKRRAVLYVMLKVAASSMQFPSALYVRGIDIGPGRVEPAECGGFADVFIGTHLGRRVALKRLRTCRAADRNLFKALCREAITWRQLKHPHILPFIGIDKETFTSMGFLCLVSPWMKRGTLKQYVRSEDYLASRDCHRILVEAAEGLQYLHAQKLVHGDLKDLNVLIDDDCHVQLCDFGLIVVGDRTAGRMTTTALGHGSGTWMSPERIIEGHRRRTSADDIYAFACLCYYMCAGHAPFYELNEMAAVLRISQGLRPEKPAAKQCNQELWALVQACWCQDPGHRPPMDAVLSHLWGLPVCLTGVTRTEDLFDDSIKVPTDASVASMIGGSLQTRLAARMGPLGLLELSSLKGEDISRGVDLSVASPADLLSLRGTDHNPSMDAHTASSPDQSRLVKLAQIPNAASIQVSSSTYTDTSIGGGTGRA